MANSRFLPYVFALCAITVAHSQPRQLEPITVERKLALVIGNQAYKRAPLRNPVNDAIAVEAALRDLGFEVVRKQDLTHRGMTQAIDEFAKTLSNGDLALFYYSGHGMQIDNDNYLNPVDLEAGDETDAKYGSYSVSQLREKFEKSGARLRIVILDACRDNPFHSSKGGAVGLAAMRETAVGTVIAYATGDNRTADDNGKGANGLFTARLVEALREPGLDLEQVFQKVKEGVYVDSQSKQNPYTYSNVVGRFYFRPELPVSDVQTHVQTIVPEVQLPTLEVKPPELSFRYMRSGQPAAQTFEVTGPSDFADPHKQAPWITLARSSSTPGKTVFSVRVSPENLTPGLHIDDVTLSDQKKVRVELMVFDPPDHRPPAHGQATWSGGVLNKGGVLELKKSSVLKGPDGQPGTMNASLPSAELSIVDLPPAVTVLENPSRDNNFTLRLRNDSSQPLSELTIRWKLDKSR